MRNGSVPSSPGSELAPETAPPTMGVGRGIAAAALLIAAGNILSRVLGQARETVISGIFGLSVESSAFAIAASIPTQLYDLIVGGLVSAALVPIFSELAERDERELGRVAGTIFTLATTIMLLTTGVAWLFAPQLGTLITLAAPPNSPIREITIMLIRWMLPATVFMALAGLITGLLQARRRFLLPAFSTATFNVGIIAGALLLSSRFGIRSLAIGMIIGGIAQVLLQLPGIRSTPLRLELALNHPDVRRIGKLYLPVLLGLGFGLVGTQVDRALAAGVSDQAAAQMRYATTLVQLALGVVATAVSLAALPTLSRQAADASDLGAYRRTLTLSIKALLLVLFPVTSLLAALARPVTSLLFQHGATGPAEAAAIASALLVYLPMLVAAGIDQPLIFAFYARRNTLLPNLVNGAAIAAYLVTAFLLVRPLGVYGLILGNVVQWWTHALLMIWFAHRRLDALQGQRLGEAVWKGLLASAVAGVTSFALFQLVGTLAVNKWLLLLQITAFGTLGLFFFVGSAALLRTEALTIFSSALLHRFRK